MHTSAGEAVEKAEPAQPTAPPRAAFEAAATRRSRHLAGFYTLLCLGALFPFSAGVIFYGWRAAALLTVMLGSTWLSVAIWSRIGARGRAMHLPQAMWMAVLLALMLPPHLLTLQPGLSPLPQSWAIVPGAGLLLAMSLWLVGGPGLSRVQPLLLTYLVVLIVFQSALSPKVVLHKSHALVGDLADVNRLIGPQSPTTREDAWIHERGDYPAQAVRIERTAAERLSSYTRPASSRSPDPTILQSLIRDAMPPLEDLVVGGHPGTMGGSSAIAVIIGGLFLMYRGLIDYKVPLYAVFYAFLAFLVLPVPVAITDQGAVWRSLLLSTAKTDLPTVVTFANYELTASPLLLTAFFLATSPSICPMSRKARGVYAGLLGVSTAVCQLYLSVSFGPYVALLLVGLLTPWLDERFRTKPLV
jgi:Na+-translocating ferredoxin:NAD+ oxidoreductase RnfD subunit